MARPRIKIDWQQFENLCSLMCTLNDIAGFFQCSEDTIERACKRDLKMSFADAFKKYSAKGKISLRRMQYKKAMDGNVAMLIWLGKQWLGQTDKTELMGSDTQPIQLAYDPTKKLRDTSKKITSSKKGK